MANKSEMMAYEYLKKTGHKNIIFRYSKTPDFKTSKGCYEIKRGYPMKTGDIKILFTKEQRQKIINCKGMVLVFLDDPEPIDIIKPDEIHLDKVRKIILHDTGEGIKKPVFVRFDSAIVKRIDLLIDKDKFDSRSSFIRRAVAEYLDELEPKILS